MAVPLGLRLRRQPHPNLVNAATLRLEYFYLEAIELEGFADGRNPPDAGEHVTADGFKTLRLDFDAQPIAYLVDVHFRAEDEGAITFLDHRFNFNVVLVADLTDDFLEQVLDCHQPRRSAVFIHRDRNLHLLALKLLQHLGDALGLGHESRGT